MDYIAILITECYEHATEMNDRKTCQFDEIDPGGTHAVDKEFPHMVLFGYEDTSTSPDSSDDSSGDYSEVEDKYCWRYGGTLISESFVLTSHSCATNGTICLALLGSSNSLNSTEHQQIRGAKAIYDKTIDYTYNNVTQLHDILLVKLNESVIFNAFIMPACLPSSTFTFEPMYTVVGWEHLQDHRLDKEVVNDSCKDLKNNHRLVKEVVNDSCKDLENVDKKFQICAESKNGFKGAPGGSLVVRHKNTRCMYTIIAVVSQNIENTTMPQAVYTRVSAYLKWIECVVWHYSCDFILYRDKV